MWRERGSLISYMYLPYKKESCGAGWDWRARVTAGGWNDVSMYMKVNSPGVLQAQLHCSILSRAADM